MVDQKLGHQAFHLSFHSTDGIHVLFFFFFINFLVLCSFFPLAFVDLHSYFDSSTHYCM